MKWIQYKITTTPDAVEAISYQIGELGIEGIEIEDAIPLSQEDKEKMYVDILEETKIKNKDLAYVKFYLSEEDDKDGIVEKVKDILGEIKNFLPIGEGTIETVITDESEWANNWKKYFKPFRVDEQIIVKPTWEPLEGYDDEDIILEIDPGMAFGTGTHETTSLCVKKLNNYINYDDIVFDIGCGSGILGIAASKLGAKKVICTDIDINAVKVATENIEVNKVKHNVEVKHGDLTETLSEKADIVVANILAEVIIVLSRNMYTVFPLSSTLEETNLRYVLLTSGFAAAGRLVRTTAGADFLKGKSEATLSASAE